MADQTLQPRLVRVWVNDPEPSVSHDVGELLSTFPGLASQVLGDGWNCGFAGGHNRLLTRAFTAGAEECLVLNPDLSLLPTALADLSAAVEAHAGPCIMSGVLLLGDRATLTQGAVQRVDSRGTVWTSTSRHLDEGHGQVLRPEWVTGRPRRTASVTGALCLVSRNSWSRITQRTGEFYDEDFFAYREDAELGLRAAAVGVPSQVLQVVVGVHFRGSPGTSRGNPVTNWWGVRNRFLLRFKYGRHRPGRRFPRACRDLVVLFAAVTVERSSASAIMSAWRLRSRMKRKASRFLYNLDRESSLEAP